ncbi:MAG: DUF1854 domain-containing protein [Kiritimatiellia bacterium]
MSAQTPKNAEPKPAAPSVKPGDEKLRQTGYRRLLPETTRVFEGSFSQLHCHVEGDKLYRGVYAMLMFPVTHPNRFVSLRCTDEHDKDQELGVIEDLAAFSEEARQVVKDSLIKQYYQRVIHRIYDITCKYGLLFFNVETGHGPERFVMAWRHDRTEEFGANGKVLLDSLDNRYIIPDVEKLPASDRRAFLGYIYW